MGIFSKKKDEEVVAAPSVAVPSQGDSKSYRVIVGPHVTEKASLLQQEGKYAFRVQSKANKIEIKRAIENLYKVKVSMVHLMHAPAKHRQVGRHQGERAGYKKAIVTLRKGEKIDIV